MFSLYAYINNKRKAVISMKLFTYRKKDDTKKYEPRKEKVKRVQWQVIALSRALMM